MVYSLKKLYCGPPSPGIIDMFRGHDNNNTYAWFGNRDVFYTHKARVGIRWICDLLKLGKGHKILAPAYNCGSEISPLLHSGASVILYRVDKKGQIDLEDLQRRYCSETKAVYIIHYFGFPQPTAEIRQFCDEKQIPMIEDCALSLFSCDGEVTLGSTGDVSIFNFPKTLPVPDGGLVLINNPDFHVDNWKMQRPPVLRVSSDMLPLMKRYFMRISSGSNLLYKVCSYMLEHKKSTDSNVDIDKHTLPDMPSGYYYDKKLNDTRISKITRLMLKKFDADSLKNIRRINFNNYFNFLSDEKDIEPLYEKLPNGVCPLYFPVIVRNRNQVCRKLNMLSISAFPFWAGYHRDLPWNDYPDACFLKDNLLVLPVHQQLDEKHIKYISMSLIKYARECAA